ncbi:homing endonuclease associated repeat-containing protein [Halalkalicoccus salilacus]|uniref:homing endonuclease associated repeat-containing protein n=1 Tax=Halalkalicoccus salilacus TaxID=3117459 RepID=UPI00300F7473
MPERIPDDELLTELQRLANKLGTTPKVQDMRDHGAFTAKTYQNRFGSWTDALAAAGFEPNKRGPAKIPTDALVEELQQLADELGTTPTKTDMANHGRFSAKVYQERFDSWNDAIMAAGLSVNSQQPAELAADELLAELQRLADEVESTPKMTDMRDHGKFSPTTYHTRFGSWNAALEAAGLTPNRQSSTEVEPNNGQNSDV